MKPVVAGKKFDGEASIACPMEDPYCGRPRGSRCAGWSAFLCAEPDCADALRGVFMSKELVISATPHETRVAIVEDGQLCEIYIEREKEFALVGSLYKGRVTPVLPAMHAAFVDIGLDSDA